MTEIVELQQDCAIARVAPELGGRITRCQLLGSDGRAEDILHPYAENHVDLLYWAKGGLYPLVPYWGRIGKASLRHEGEVIPLCPHPDANPHTLHGTAHQAKWSVTHRGDATLTLRLEKDADAHWPWRYEAVMVLTLTRGTLRVELSVRNIDRGTMPAGIGLHPYLCHRTSDLLQFEARTQWSMTPDFLAIGAQPTGPDEDFRAARSPDLATFTTCYGDWKGRFKLSRATEARPSVSIVASPTFDHLVLHRPDGAPYLCVEPVSHTADAFNKSAAGLAHTGTRVLAPGQILRGSVEFVLE